MPFTTPAALRWLAAAGALSLAACANDDDPPQLSYALDFPSEAAAIASQSVTVYVFPAAPGSDCLSLIDARTFGKELPAGAQTATAQVCALQSGAQRPELEVEADEVTILAVAQRSQGGGPPQDFLIGCAKQRADDRAPLPVSLTFINYEQSVPATSCPTLSSWCAGQCAS
jgi:hypothetical protein